MDNNLQLNFVIHHLPNQPSDRGFLLNGKQVQKIETKTQRVLISMDSSQINSLPEYLGDNEAVNPQPTPQTNYQMQPTTVTPQVVEEDIVRLLGERLVVDRSKRKVGEVIVRKEIETHIVQVPVRREKLIVEQVSPEHRQLASIDLSQGEIPGIELTAGESLDVESFHHLNGGLTVSGEFNSPKVASLLLNAIALEKNPGCHRVRITIEVDDQAHQQLYQEWFARTSISKEQQ